MLLPPSAWDFRNFFAVYLLDQFIVPLVPYPRLDTSVRLHGGWYYMVMIGYRVFKDFGLERWVP